MIAVKQIQTEISTSKQSIIDQIWLSEEQLAFAEMQSADLAAHVASDFVSFDVDGNAIAKSDYIEQIGQAADVNMTRLWGHFGSKDSCCLAYLREKNDGVVDICMALWIERDGNWYKTFHHENLKFG
ncbi:hypothetical protein [Maritalea porphyrae]|jgi:hypothetical protein|uniref:hypothetical protein n=1 Tax=Maritalea porphyrae TaxID=880732 RepID=UPI0022AF8023|nr:hypothetical protein [Maritalea porphyrae]MCZ4272778.1 hypothetical protein [Maritalea porphyrae]